MNNKLIILSIGLLACFIQTAQAGKKSFFGGTGLGLGLGYIAGRSHNHSSHHHYDSCDCNCDRLDRELSRCERRLRKRRR